MKLVINRCFGGFGLSTESYEMLIELGIPVQAHRQQRRNAKTGLYEPEPRNDGEIIFDRTLEPESDIRDRHIEFMGRYWDTWLQNDRSHPLLLQVVETLGTKASDRHAELAIVEIPDGVEYDIDEYDGWETVHERHRSWG